MLEMRKREADERQDRIDRAVENYACRPQVEIDRERVQKERSGNKLISTKLTKSSYSRILDIRVISL